MYQDETILRKIPKVDDVLNQLTISMGLSYISHPAVIQTIREILGSLRSRILEGSCLSVPDIKEIVLMVTEAVSNKSRMNLRPVINATGIILHTNLGRAKISGKVMDEVVKTAVNYSTLEYNLTQGTRGSRYSHVEELITDLTGAESAMVVNNNAAAVILILNTMTRDKEVIISRGEMVEIGDSFRIPAIMEQSGCQLVEVGTTNKTYISDYKNAIHSGKTGALLKVHTSNYKIVGFTETPTLEELTILGRDYSVPIIIDVGSGSIFNLEKYGITDEPTPQQCVAAGADIVCFSADKLLGGPQSGIIAGKKIYIDNMKKNPLARAVRIDKLCLAALEATLRIYADGTEEKDIPTIRMLTASIDILAVRAAKLFEDINENNKGCSAEIVKEFSEVGGGSVPCKMLPTFAVSIKPYNLSVIELEQRLRQNEIPIIARISKNRLMLDVRTIEENELPIVVNCLMNNLNI